MRYIPYLFIGILFSFGSNWSFAQCDFLGEVSDTCNLSVERIDGKVFEIDNPPSVLELGQNIRFSVVELGESPSCIGVTLASLSCYAILDNSCSDFDQIDTTESCGAIYDPVCGCDGVSYVNSCQAEKWNGIIQWTTGPCSDLPITCVARFEFAYIDDNTVVFYNHSEAYNDFQWDFGSGIIDYQGMSTAVVSFMEDVEEVCISISNIDGCTDQFCQTISMDSPDELCANTDCVWPGDSDGDGKANNLDLLNIGLGFGAMGPPRMDFPYDNDPIAWAPNYADNWDENINLIDYKHLDCDGNGEINEDDLQAIYNNYTPDFDYISYPVDNAPPIFIEFTTNEIIIDEDTPDDILLEAKLYMGSTVYDFDDLHGVALSITFPYDLIVPNSVDFTYNDGSFFGAADQTLAIEYDLAPLGIGRYDISLSQQATAGVGGLGEIGTFNFVVSSDIIDGLSSPEIPFDIIIDKVRLVDAFGDDLDFNIPTPTSLTIINDSLANTPEVSLDYSVAVFPNPVTNQVFINGGDYVVEQVTMANTDGNVLKSLSFRENTVAIPTNDVVSGVYILQIRTSEFIVNRRIVVR
jgi:hypothetical protein